jgi:hypothetical protein
LAIKIFNNKYSKLFLHQLVSSQLDMDRLDYLKRDSFYSGVTEGNIGADRIINMLNVVNDNLVVEEKGIYSIEKFLFARRLMYWQVYLHKTVISAENTLINVFKRAKELTKLKKEIYTTPSVAIFLEKNYSYNDFKNIKLLNHFSELDDYEIYTCLKQWVKEKDFVLSNLSKIIINRNLLKIEIQNEEFNHDHIKKKIDQMIEAYNITFKEASYFIFSNKVSNSTYNIEKTNINILSKNDKTVDITIASDQLNSKQLEKTEKYYLCYPKSI